jgi:hypothetical protein
MTNQELAQDYFDRHPSNDVCFITSDGRVFHQEGTAKGYAGALEKFEVEKFERKTADAVLEVVEEEEKQEPIDVKALLEGFNPETTTYDEAKALFTQLELTAPSKKKEDIFNALAEAKANTIA